MPEAILSGTNTAIAGVDCDNPSPLIILISNWKLSKIIKTTYENILKPLQPTIS